MLNRSLRGLFLLCLLGIILFVFTQFQGGFVSWFLFYSFIPIALYSFIVYFLAFRGIEVERQIPKKKMTAGETLQVEVTMRRSFPLPLVYMLITDHLDPKLEGRLLSQGNLIHPLQGRTFHTKYEILELPRGLYRWNEITLQTGDPFGLIKKEMSFSQADEVVVYPKYQEIRQWRSMNEKNMGMNQTVHRKAEDVSLVMGVRDYAPGDKLSRIHWKASAKIQQLRTKEFEHQVTNDFMFFLDREQASYGAEEHPLFERAVSLTASLAKYALKNHFSTGLVSYGSFPSTLPMTKDQEQLYRIFEHLARIKADATLSFAKTILKEVVYLPTGTTVVIISPRLDKKLALLLGDLSYRKIKVEFFWIREKQPLTNEERSHLQLMEGVQVTYYLVTEEKFSEVLSGGERHVSASQ